MKTQGWLAAALVAGGSVMAMRGCLSKPEPDVRLAERFDDLCDVARKHVDTPEKGVRAIGNYLARHADDMLGEWGGTLVTIEKIGDDGKHDARARLARERLQKPLKACEADWARFGQAVQDSPEASELVGHAAERLNRTLEILFGARAHFDFAHLPEQLERAI
ncbi:MAG: hypothetical protein ACM31C_12840 [Acidobacteriota bacterium]